MTRGSQRGVKKPRLTKSSSPSVAAWNHFHPGIYLLFSQGEYTKLHLQFHHKSPLKLFQLRRRAEPGRDTKGMKIMLKLISAACDACETLAICLLDSGRPCLHMGLSSTKKLLSSLSGCMDARFFMLGIHITAYMMWRCSNRKMHKTSGRRCRVLDNTLHRRPAHHARRPRKSYQVRPL